MVFRADWPFTLSPIWATKTSEESLKSLPTRLSAVDSKTTREPSVFGEGRSARARAGIPPAALTGVMPLTIWKTCGSRYRRLFVYGAAVEYATEPLVDRAAKPASASRVPAEQAQLAAMVG